jgi:hypothetical protein
MDKKERTYDILLADFCPAGCASGGNARWETADRQRYHEGHERAQPEALDEEAIEQLVAVMKTWEIQAQY